MTERIKRLTDLTLKGEMTPKSQNVIFDREDLFLSKMKRESKRIYEYVTAQLPIITPDSTMTGFFRFNDSVVGDAFNVSGHTAAKAVMRDFYLQAVDNLSTMEWQHATADYSNVLRGGYEGLILEIEESMQTHQTEEAKEFLGALKTCAKAMIDWAIICAKQVEKVAETIEDNQQKTDLLRLATTLTRVPRYAPETFYEAILAIYISFSLAPDSIGALDRYLLPYYERDLQKGTLTKEKAKEMLQELFLMLQSATPVESNNFTKGGQSHFCVGGYLEDGNDGCSDLTKLIIESLMELPTYIPQITFRWTKLTPRETLRFVMDCERKDVNKRIAFTNDEKRLQCFTKICNIPYEKAVGYTLTGCNEPVFLGAISASTSKGNFVKSIETLFHRRADEIAKTKTFDEFYEIYERELFSDLDKIYEYDDKYNLERAKDINYVSSLIFNDCIKNAKSISQGGTDYAVSTPMMCGITNAIDSLCVVKQFVFEERQIEMQTLIDAVQNNWKGFETLHTLIVKKCDFFGNDGAISNTVARRVYNSVYSYLKGKKNVFGYPIILGDIVGYNEHHRWFGEKTKATPDGRYDGDLLKYGLGQSGGYDREGISALLHSIATVDANAIGCGSTVTNLMVDEKLVYEDSYFEKLVDAVQTYFLEGGVQLQLAYVSKTDLLKAKECPQEYRNLRVRVTGYSDYFVRLQESVQDSIIARTNHNE